MNRELAKYVDVMIGNEEDFTACLGLQVEGMDEQLLALDPANFKKMIQLARAAVPELPGGGHHPAQRQDRQHQRLGRDLLASATTSTWRRCARTWRSTTGWAAATRSPRGLIYGFLAGKGPQYAVECGAAHGALAMTTPG